MSSCSGIDEELLDKLRSFKIKNQNQYNNHSTISELDENLLMKHVDSNKRNSSPVKFKVIHLNVTK